MRVHKYLLVLALACAVSATTMAAQQATGKGAASRLTVGDFAAMLATSRQAGPTTEASRAIDSLVRTGVPLGDLRAPLTEQKLVEIMGFYGVSAKSSTSSEPVGKGKAEAALLLINAAPGRVGAEVRPDAAGHPSPQQTPLDDCLAQPNHGQCVNCCKPFLSILDPNNTSGGVSACSKFCMQINKGSSPEPIP